MAANKTPIDAFTEIGFVSASEEDPTGYVKQTHDGTYVRLSLGTDDDRERIEYWSDKHAPWCLYYGRIPTYEFAVELLNNIDINNLM